MRAVAYQLTSIQAPLARVSREDLLASARDSIVRPPPLPDLRGVRLKIGHCSIHPLRLPGPRERALPLQRVPRRVVRRQRQPGLPRAPKQRVPKLGPLRQLVRPRPLMQRQQHTAGVSTVVAVAASTGTTKAQDFLVSSSSSSGVRGQSSRRSRDSARSASSFPWVWQCGQ
jgi:hypothetical protein